MKLDYEWVIYSHRPHRWQPIAAEAIVRLCPETIRLTVIREPGTAAMNLNRGLDICRSRYLFLMDEDCILKQVGWVGAMLAMTGKPDFGIGGCQEALTEEDAAALPPTAEHGPVVRVVRQPGYVHLIDTMRCKGLRFDEKCPGASGMTDIDICAQARIVKGLGVYRNNGAFVYHQVKVDEDSWRRANHHDLWTDMQKWYPEQVKYMDSKWGAGNW